MHGMGLWWRQPDHYDWLSDYLAARGLKPFVRYLLAAIVTNLAAATLLMLFSSSGPQTPMRRAVAVAFVVSLAAMTLVWLLSWPTRFQSQMFSITGALGIAAICVIESDPRSGMLGRAAWWPGGLRGVFSFRSPAGFHAGQRLRYCTGVRRPHRCGW
jgi:cell division protein FtsW (lipid II flippase)